MAYLARKLVAASSTDQVGELCENATSTRFDAHGGAYPREVVDGAEARVCKAAPGGRCGSSSTKPNRSMVRATAEALRERGSLPESGADYHNSGPQCAPVARSPTLIAARVEREHERCGHRHEQDFYPPDLGRTVKRVDGGRGGQGHDGT